MNTTFFATGTKRRNAAMRAVLRLINLADLLGLNIHNFDRAPIELSPNGSLRVSNTIH